MVAGSAEVVWLQAHVYKKLILVFVEDTNGSGK